MTDQEITDIYFRLYDTLPEEIAERAKANFNVKKARIYSMPEDAREAISSGFNWNRSLEDYDYWQSLYNELKAARK